MEPAPSPAAPLGQPRGIAFVILIGIITFGIYWIYWAYKTQDEMKKHTGEGLGGILGLVIWIVINPVSAFVIPAEVGAMYRGAGKTAPIGGWTGLWLFPFGFLIIPGIVWGVKVQGSLNRYWEAAAATSSVPPPAAPPAPVEPAEAPATPEPLASPEPPAAPEPPASA